MVWGDSDKVIDASSISIFYEKYQKFQIGNNKRMRSSSHDGKTSGNGFSISKFFEGRKIVKKNNFWLAVLLSSFFLFSGCTLIIIGAAAPFFVDGKLTTDYRAPFDETWHACEKTIVDMHGVDVVSVKEIEHGKITTLINAKKVKFEITCKSENLTTVAIRVGLTGNKQYSQMLHEKIGESLAKN